MSLITQYMPAVLTLQQAVDEGLAGAGAQGLACSVVEEWALAMRRATKVGSCTRDVWKSTFFGKKCVF